MPIAHMGYLPEALRNYLVRLGWSHGDQEIFSTEEMIEAFDLARHRAFGGALRLRQAREPQRPLYAQTADDAALVAAFEAVLPYIPNGPAVAAKLTPATRAQLLTAMPGLKERAKTLVELVDSANYLFAERPLQLDDKAAAQIYAGRTQAARRPGADIRCRFATGLPRRPRLRCATTRKRPALKLGSIAQPLRAALTGRTTSPGIFDVLAVLGKDECLARLRDIANP